MAVETWNDKLGEAKHLIEKARGIYGDPESSEEEKANAAKMIEKAEKLKEEGFQLKDLFEQAQQIAQAEADEQKDETFEESQPPAGNEVGEFKSWEEYLIAIWANMAHRKEDPRLKWFGEERKSGHQQKSMSSTSGAAGGFLIPEQFIAQLQAVQSENTLWRAAGATVIRMSSRQVTLPVLDQTGTTAGRPHWFGGMRFYWKDESDLKTETEPEFRQVTLAAKKLIGLTNVPDELLDDSAISLADFLSGPMGFAGGISWMEDYAFFQGTGGGQPLGVLNSPVLLTPARAAGGNIGYTDVIDMLQEFMPSARGAWFISHSALSQIIQMTGPAGNPSYVWQPNAREGTPGYLFGYPVYWTEKLPVLGETGDILLADPRYYLVGDRQATTIESTKFHRWAYDETTWRAVHRVDGQPWLEEPITYQDGETQVSPFVALGSTAGT